MERQVYEVKIYNADLDEIDVFLMYGTCKNEYVVEICVNCLKI